MQILRAGAVYFALVLGAGFVLGPVRVLLLVPLPRQKSLSRQARGGRVRNGEARMSLVRRMVNPHTVSMVLAVGGVAIGLLLLSEFTVVLWLRGLTIPEYFASRDPVAWSLCGHAGGVCAHALASNLTPG